MFTAGERVAVAVSGGKDSAALLLSLKEAFPNVEFIPVHVDLGIEGYSAHCLEKARELAKMLDLELVVYHLRDEKGVTIDDFLHTRFRRKLCSVCGVIKRRVFNELANRVEADVLATGHNLDDMVEIMFSTFLAGDFEQLVRLKPVIPPFHPKLVRKVKPLYRIPERETALYAKLNHLPVREIDCPHLKGSRLLRRKRLIELYSKEDPSFKFQLSSVFLKRLIPILEEHVSRKGFQTCEICGYPSSDRICGCCKKILEARRAINER